MANNTAPLAATRDFQYRQELAAGTRGQKATIRITALHIDRTPSVVFKVVKLIMQQNFSPRWEEEQAYGKMDPIATYSHTRRMIKFHFTVWADDDDNLDNLASDIETFAQFNYPTYIPGKTALKAPPFFEVETLGGNYMPKLQGYISSINIVPGHSKGAVLGDEDEEGNGYKRDRAYEIDFDFVVLHRMAPGWVGSTFPTPDGGFMFASAPNVGAVVRDQLGLPRQRGATGLKKFTKKDSNPSQTVQEERIRAKGCSSSQRWDNSKKKCVDK